MQKICWKKLLSWQQLQTLIMFQGFRIPITKTSSEYSERCLWLRDAIHKKNSIHSDIGPTSLTPLPLPSGNFNYLVEDAVEYLLFLKFLALILNFWPCISITVKDFYRDNFQCCSYWWKVIIRCSIGQENYRACNFSRCPSFSNLNQ